MRRGIRSISVSMATLGLITATMSFAQQADAATIWSQSLIDSIDALPVATELRTGYSRDLFPHWIDVDGDCQNARAEVLITETLSPVTFTTASNCTVATGQWFSYYDGQTSTLASDFDIDHMVPLAEAWDSGAHSWTTSERQAFANDIGDPRTLIAVTDNSNVAKSDSDPAQWLPTFEKCRYIAEWVAVKIRWALTVDTTEKSALSNLAGTCPPATVTVTVARGAGPTPPTTTTTAPSTLQLTGTSRTTSSIKYADLTWTGSPTRFDLWRDTTRLLSNTTVRSHTDRVSKSTRKATYTVCPAGVLRTSPQCSSVTLAW